MVSDFGANRKRIKNTLDQRTMTIKLAENLYKNEKRNTFISESLALTLESRLRRTVMAAVAKDLSYVVLCVPRVFTLNSIDQFYKGYDKKNEHCIIVHIYLSTDYLPEIYRDRQIEHHESST